MRVATSRATRRAGFGRRRLPGPARCSACIQSVVGGYADGALEYFLPVCAVDLGSVPLKPRLPADWDRLRFRVQIRGQVVEADMTPGATTLTLCEGPGLLVELSGEELRLRERLLRHRRRVLAGRSGELCGPLSTPPVWLGDAAGLELRH
jgi:glycosyl hydrolase family 65